MIAEIAYPKFIQDIDSILSKIGLDLYTLCLGAGVVFLTEYFIRQLEKKHGYSHRSVNRILLILSISLVAAYGFAWFFDGLYHFLNGERFEAGGLTFSSGFIGGALIFSLLIFWFMKEERKNILTLFNIMIPGVVIAHAIGRFGCFTAGCCHGLPTDSVFGVVFPKGYYADSLYGQIPVHPTQLYEAFFLFAFYFVLIYVPFAKNHKFSVYLIGYGFFRILMELFFRGDRRGELLGMPPSLLISIVMAVAGLVILIFELQTSLRKKADL